MEDSCKKNRNNKKLSNANELNRFSPNKHDDIEDMGPSKKLDDEVDMSEAATVAQNNRSFGKKKQINIDRDDSEIRSYVKTKKERDEFDYKDNKRGLILDISNKKKRKLEMKADNFPQLEKDIVVQGKRKCLEKIQLNSSINSDTETSESSNSDVDDVKQSKKASLLTEEQNMEGKRKPNVPNEMESMSQSFSSVSEIDESIDDDCDAKVEEEDEFALIRKELATIPFEDLIKVKERLGLKVFGQIMKSGKFNAGTRKVFKRENKNRPMEISSKRKVSILRHHNVPKEKIRRDPRFDDLSGEFQEHHFEKNFSFLDEVKARERLLVQKKIEKTKDENKKAELKKLLTRMEQQQKVDKSRKERVELEQQWKQKEKSLVKEGKAPYFLKKSDKKKLILAEKFKELEKSGTVDKYLSKKFVKNAHKEKKKLPVRHQRQ